MRSRHDEIQALNASVVVISFGPKDRLKVWQEEMQMRFLVLLDSKREGYEAYGLEQSLLRSWGLKNLWYYVKALLKGKRPHGWHGKGTGQLGGDFVVDSEGILRYAHPSRDPTDRPEAEKLLDILGQIS